VSARSKARKQALDLLYETDIRGTNLLDTLAERDIPADGPDARPMREYTRELINGVSLNRRKIDLVSSRSCGPQTYQQVLPSMKHLTWPRNFLVMTPQSTFMEF